MPGDAEFVFEHVQLCGEVVHMIVRLSAAGTSWQVKVQASLAQGGQASHLTHCTTWARRHPAPTQAHSDVTREAFKLHGCKSEASDQRVHDRIPSPDEWCPESILYTLVAHVFLQIMLTAGPRPRSLTLRWHSFSLSKLRFISLDGGQIGDTSRQRPGWPAPFARVRTFRAPGVSLPGPRQACGDAPGVMVAGAKPVDFQSCSVASSVSRRESAAHVRPYTVESVMPAARPSHTRGPHERSPR